MNSRLGFALRACGTPASGEFMPWVSRACLGKRRSRRAELGVQRGQL